MRTLIQGFVLAMMPFAALADTVGTLPEPGSVGLVAIGVVAGILVVKFRKRK